MKVKLLMFWLCLTLINATKFAKTVELQKWEDYKTEFAKHYAASDEDERRMKIFQRNLRKIEKHNEKFKKGEVSHGMEVNKFSDMTAKEFARTHLSNRTLCAHFNEMVGSELSQKIMTTPQIKGTPPKFKNWVTEGVFSPVKNQDDPERCESCSAFAVTGAIESHYFIKTGKRISLSEQNLLDCVGDGYDCSGGSMCDSFRYIINNRGIASAKSYPYTGRKGPCRYKPKKRGVMIRSYNQSEPGNEEMLKSIVGLIGPVTCTFYADDDFTGNYKHGVYSSPTCDKYPPNHAVLVVGYGIENNEPYWLVKNSWGPNWGLGGYFKLRRGTNECNMAANNFYPVF